MTKTATIQALADLAVKRGDYRAGSSPAETEKGPFAASAWGVRG